MKNAYFSDDPLHEHADSLAYPVLAGIVLFHALLLAGLFMFQRASDPVRVDILSVRLLQTSPPIDAPVKPVPVKPIPQPLQKPKPVIKRVVTDEPAAAPLPEPKPLPLPPQPVPKPVEQPPEPVLSAPVVPPRFDAAYLNNPSPSYPALSRRNGEAGKVMLRIQVSSDGRPLQVELQRSSGYSRLDDAALAAVRQWRFIPAKRGEENLTEWVLVPLVFKLTN
ncbi:MAG: energy transducer TonB [Pseudomonadota bacterium]